MNIFDLLTMVGGLALFLYGMKVMGDSLTKMAGSKMAIVLEQLTNNRLSGVLLGTIVTAIIQSSSATTVMVVGFVNSGIMNLSQAVGVIMGANIGTTVTSWLLSLTGLQGDVIWIQMLKPSSFAPVIAIVGIILLMVSKDNGKKESIASIMIGFAVLMFGMETMSDAVAPLADNPAFGKAMVAFSNPILGTLVGTLFTTVIQSSSASVGILQAFALTGVLNYATAIPIIMGQNIGTCGTALLSSVGASKNGKRAAMIHLNFNLIGTLIFMVVFYGINSFVPFDFLSHRCTPADIALIHSLFNIGSTVVLLPFANMIIDLALKLIPDRTAAVKENELESIYIDDRFLRNPGFVLELCRKKALDMALDVEDAINISLNLLKYPYEKQKAKQVKEYEDHIDEYGRKLQEYLLKLSQRDLSHEDTERIVIIQHTLKDLEEISDYARALQKDAHKIEKKNLQFSENIRADFEKVLSLVQEILSKTNSVLLNDDIILSHRIEEIEDDIYKQKKKLTKHFIKQMQQGNVELELGIIIENILIKFERIAAHCSNIVFTIQEIDG